MASSNGETPTSDGSEFAGSVAVRRSGFLDIFDRSISLWNNTDTVLRESVRLGNIVGGMSTFVISPDNSKILVYDYDIQCLVLFDSRTAREISRVTVGNNVIHNEMSFSSDGRLVAVPLINEATDSYFIRIVKIPSLETDSEIPFRYNACNMCRFMPRNSSRLLIFERHDQTGSIRLYDMPTGSDVWTIDNVVGTMFELTKDASKVLVGIKTTDVDKELILADTQTGNVVSRMAHPLCRKIDCAVFSDDETKLVISMDDGIFMQIIPLPFIALDQTANLTLNKFALNGLDVEKMILSPDSNSVLQVCNRRISIVDLVNKREVRGTRDISFGSYFNGIEVSSDETMLVFSKNALVSLMYTHTRSERSERWSAVFLAIILASRRRRMRHIPSEIWCMIFEEFAAPLVRKRTS